MAQSQTPQQQPPKPCQGFLAQVNQQFADTNATVPGALAPPGMSLLTARALSNATGLPTLGNIAIESFQAGQLTLGVEFGVYLSGMNFVVTGAMFEAGLYAGSMAYTGYSRAMYGNPSGQSCVAGP